MTDDASTDDASTDDASTDGSGGGSGSSDDSGSSKGKNALEWTITALGAALVLFVLGFLAYEWATAGDGSADLAVTLGAPAPDGATVRIPVEVKNQGPRVAEAAVIEVCAGPASCAQLTFDYVPFESTVTGSVGLEAPLAAPPTSRVVSFRDP